MVPKVRVELTRGHPHRFLSLVRVVLISVARRDLVHLPGDATRRMGAGDDSPHIIKEVILVVSIQAIKRRTTYGR